jgi:hypothetical protein
MEKNWLAKSLRFAGVISILMLVGGIGLWFGLQKATAQEPVYELINLSQWWSLRFDVQSEHVMDQNGEVKIKSDLNRQAL